MTDRTLQCIAFDIRNDTIAKIQRLSFSYHDRNQNGQLMIRATDDMEKVRLFIAQGLVMAAQGLILLVCTLILEFAANWRLTLVVLPTLPIALVIFIAFGMIVQPLFTRVQQRISSLNTVLQESLAGIKVVKAFAREDYEQKRFDKAADSLKDALVRNAQILSFLFPLVFLVAPIGQPLILYFGGQQILAGSLSYGEYQKFSLYLAFLFFPLFQLGFIIPLIGQAAASSIRIFDILETKSDITDKPGSVDMPPINGPVQFRKVPFRYFDM